MRRINNKSIIVISLIIAYLILAFFFLMKYNFKTFNNILNPIFWFLLLILSHCFFKNEYVNKKYKYDILLSEIIIIISFFIIYYLIGLFVGFTPSPYSSALINILNNIGMASLVIIAQEYVREKLINRTGINKKLLILITVCFILVDIISAFFVYDLSSGEKIFQFIVEILNAAIAKHCLLSYLGYKAGKNPSLIYRLAMECFSFIIPLEPNVGWFLMGVINIILPFLIYIKSESIFEKRNDQKLYKRNYKRKLFYIPIFMILIILVILVSGLFKYQFIAIASNSMVPTFYRGDAIIIEKIDNADNIKVGDIMVFYSGRVTVIHRVVEKIETASGEYLFKTKGDNNKSFDLDLVNKKQVIGKYIATFKWLGYPSLLLQELF